MAGGNDLAHMKKPYQVIAAELKKQDRDIVLNLCQYGMGEVWKWGGEVGQCWRTTGDLGLERGSRLPGFYGIGFSNASHWKNAKPGCWNDPDYLLIGYVGDASQMGAGRKTTLTPDEQYSYMSMWCLMAAPLIFSGDMARLDPLTLNVLCNAEVIDVDQDALGRQAASSARHLASSSSSRIWETAQRPWGFSTWARPKPRLPFPGAIWGSAASSRSAIYGGREICRQPTKSSRPRWLGTG